MKRSLKQQLLCSVSVFLLVSSGMADRLPEAGVYWHGVRQIPPTPEALNKTLKDHELWIESSGEAGTRADFSHGNLANFDLRGANLWRANLERTYLAGADLTLAVLGSNGQ